MKFPLRCLEESAFISFVHLALYSHHEESGDRRSTEAAFEKAYAIMTRKADRDSVGRQLIDLSVEIDERVDRLQGCDGYNLPGMLEATLRTGSNRIVKMGMDPWNFRVSHCPVDLLGVLLDDLAGGLSFYLLRFGKLPPSFESNDVSPESLLQMRCLLLAFNPIGCTLEVKNALESHLRPLFETAVAQARERLSGKIAAASQFVFELLQARCQQAIELCAPASQDSYAWAS